MLVKGATGHHQQWHSLTVLDKQVLLCHLTVNRWWTCKCIFHVQFLKGQYGLSVPIIYMIGCWDCWVTWKWLLVSDINSYTHWPTKYVILTFDTRPKEDTAKLSIMWILVGISCMCYCLNYRQSNVAQSNEYRIMWSDNCSRNYYCHNT